MAARLRGRPDRKRQPLPLRPVESGNRIVKRLFGNFTRVSKSRVKGEGQKGDSKRDTRQHVFETLSCCFLWASLKALKGIPGETTHSGEEGNQEEKKNLLSEKGSDASQSPMCGSNPNSHRSNPQHIKGGFAGKPRHSRGREVHLSHEKPLSMNKFKGRFLPIAADPRATPKKNAEKKGKKKDLRNAQGGPTRQKKKCEMLERGGFLRTSDKKDAIAYAGDWGLPHWFKSQTAVFQTGGGSKELENEKGMGGRRIVQICLAPEDRAAPPACKRKCWANVATTGPEP